MNVCECIVVGAKLFPNTDALVFEGNRLTYSELERLSAQAAAQLQDAGVSRGDRVGLVLANVPAFPVWYYATLRIGAIAVSISTRLTAEEVSFILSDCGAKALVVGSDSELNSGMPDSVKRTFRVSEDGLANDGELLAGPGIGLFAFLGTEPNDPAVILYTSGTTGFPKGATLSHQNVRATVHAFNHLCGMEADDRILLSVPLFHCYGQNALLNSALNVGATLVLQRRFDLNESKQLIIEHGVTKLFGVPTTFQLLLDACQAEDLRSVSYCFSAAATLPIQISESWRDKFQMPIYEGYGLTETAPFASYNHALQFVPGSIGTPVDLVEMRVVDLESGQECPAGVAGEIVIRGPNVMLGYWNRPEETAEAIRDGWFHSGDIGQTDPQGYFYIVDRVKDMISIGGMKVFPAEVERVLLDHWSIDQAAVVGFPDRVFGERVVAFVVPKGGDVDTGQLREHCVGKLAAYKTPKQFVVVDDLPRNPTGKILKTQLRQIEIGEDRQDTAAINRDESSEQPGVSDLDSPLLTRLQSVHAAQREREVTKLIQDEVRELTGSPDELDEKIKLLDAGLDSLAIVELRDRLQQHVGKDLELPATLVFDHPRICDVSQYLVEALTADSAPMEHGAAGSTPKEGQTPERAADQAETPVEQTRRSALETMSEEEALEALLREVTE